MPKMCPDCGNDMVPADGLECSQANWVCPTCAPAFIKQSATSYLDP